LDSKIDNRHHTCKLLYLVKLAGYEGTDEETSWLLATELGHAAEIVTDFHNAYPDKPGPLSNHIPRNTHLLCIHFINPLFALCLMFCFYRKSLVVQNIK
jgi:hypothetical protein